MVAARIACVLDERLLREALALHLRADAGFEVVASLAPGPATFQQLLATASDVVVVQFWPLTAARIAFVRDLRRRQPQSQSILYAPRVTNALIEQVVRLKAVGCLTADSGIDEFLDAVGRVADGGYAFDEHVRERLQGDPRNGSVRILPAFDRPALSDRQLDVLRHLALGRTRREVADILHVTEKSIEGHTYRIMKKLGVRDRVALTRYAIREGLVPP